jgi:glycosyltransferase involved in cell wall biosynthesis
LKILLAHNYYNHIGGAEVFYHEVGRVLQENNHTVAYFSPNDSDVVSEWKPYFPDVVDYKGKNKLKSIIGIKDMIYSTKTKDKFKQLLNDFKPDIVHVFAIYIRLTPSILDACREYGVPVVMSCNDYKHICPSYKLYRNGHLCEDCKGGKFYNAIINRCAKDSLMYSTASALEAYVHNSMDIYRKNISMFLFASEFMAKKTEEFWGEETFKWDMLKNPFESKKYQLSTEYEDYCLYFGRLIDEKGVDVLIKAMSHIPQCKLKIVGNGPDEDALKKLVKELGINSIEFCGPKWGEELDSILKKSRFVVVPSLWHENFPYVILQSFAFGKAVIGSNRGGIPELVSAGEHGYIYEATDDIELSEKIKMLWESPEIAVSMGKSAKYYMDENFNDEKFYKNIMRIYNKVLS